MFKADAALDAAAASAANAGHTGTNSSATTGPAKRSAERDKVQSKLDFSTALSHFGQANYEKAAIAFLNLGSPSRLGDWVGKASSKHGSHIVVELTQRLDCGSWGYCHIRNAVCTF